MNHDIVFISLENWDHIWRRNQFICAEYARRHPDACILFVGLSINVSYAVRRFDFSVFKSQRSHVVPELPSITVTHALKLAPNTLTVGRKLNEYLLTRHIRSAIQQLQMSRPILWINDHAAEHLVHGIDHSAVIYDITDDWLSLTQSPRLVDLIRRQDAALCSRADATIVCSQRLFDMKQTLARNLYLIPNGVDSSHYSATKREDGPLPQAAENWPRPVYGYTGTIHPDRVDLKLIEFLSQRLKNGSLVLVGPDHFTPEQHDRIAQCKNVFLTGPVAYRDVPSYMRAFDVCLTPHVVSPFTESLNPIKLWEYLACGKPIVSTNVAGFRDYPQLVRLAATPEDFLIQMLAAAQENNAQLAAARRAEAQKHSWVSRMNDIEKVITVALDAKQTEAAV